MRTRSWTYGRSSRLSNLMRKMIRREKIPESPCCKSTSNKSKPSKLSWRIKISFSNNSKRSFKGWIRTPRTTNKFWSRKTNKSTNSQGKSTTSKNLSIKSHHPSKTQPSQPIWPISKHKTPNKFHRYNTSQSSWALPNPKTHPSTCKSSSYRVTSNSWTSSNPYRRWKSKRRTNCCKLRST